MNSLRRVKPSYWLVAAIVVAVMGWLMLRPFFGGGTARAAAAPAPSAGQAPLVEARLVEPQIRPRDIVFNGRTQAFRTVEVRSETSGPVAATPVVQGSFVPAGTVLCRLAVDARAAQLDEARATQRSKALMMQASDRLAQQGYRSRTQVLAAQADLDSAAAAVRQAQVALSQIDLRAPFAGVFDRREAEIGAYLTPGGACGVMIQLDPILIVGFVPETDVGALRVGEPAAATLVSGRRIVGRVRSVARDADPATRTYRVEVIAANPDRSVASGLSAQLAVQAGVAPAHLAPVSALVLDSEGRQGVRYVGADGVVAFAPVKILEVTPHGVWLSGLSGPTRIITVGQDYVAAGQRVRVAKG